MASEPIHEQPTGISRGRNWVFILNNYTEDEYNRLVGLEGHKQIRYMIFGKEIGENAHTPHLQGFIIFYNPKTFNQVKQFFGERFHIEKCIGNVKQNIAYCSKDEDYYSFGEEPQQGSRKDIEEVKDMIKAGKPINEIMFASRSYQSARHAELLMKYAPAPKPQKRIIKWYYGSTGTGKTKTAVEESGGDFWMSRKDMKWWQGYHGQKYVIIDDFRKDFCSFHELLRILDRYPYNVDIKGADIWLQPTTEVIIITSPFNPAEVYQNKEDIKQLLRRIDFIYCFYITNNPDHIFKKLIDTPLLEL